jgi:hypothetical protein
MDIDFDNRNGLDSTEIEASSVPQIVIEGPPLTLEQANELTVAIKNSATTTFRLVKQAHESRIWLTTGHGSWEKYVEAELPISVSTSYNLLNQAKVSLAIENATGVALDVTIKQANAAKGHLDEIGETAKQAADLYPEDAVAAQLSIKTALQDFTEKLMDKAAADHDTSHIPAETFDGFSNDYQNVDTLEDYENSVNAAGGEGTSEIVPPRLRTATQNASLALEVLTTLSASMAEISSLLSPSDIKNADIALGILNELKNLE